MPKDRKKTYSDHQAQASRLKKQAMKQLPKTKPAQQDEAQNASRVMEQAIGEPLMPKGGERR
jgi:hypothetical protein